MSARRPGTRDTDPRLQALESRVRELERKPADPIRVLDRHLADIAQSLAKIARSLEVTISIEGGSAVPPTPTAKGETS